MLNKRLSVFLVSCHFGSILACWGSSGSEEDDEMRNKRYDPNNKEIWGGWDPPPGAPQAWSNWLKDYKAANQGKGGAHDPNIHGGKPYGHGEKGWPADWAGLGPPYQAIAPPPWAYVPKNVGKPSYCYDPPLFGNCTRSITRYGYNGFMDECQKFDYSGCGGNRNNFEKLESCIKACMGTPESGCETDSKIPVDTFVWSRRCGYSEDDPNDYLDVRSY